MAKKLKLNLFKVFRRYKQFKDLLAAFWELYFLVREYLDVLKKEPQFEKVMEKIYSLKVEVFGEMK